MPKRRNKIGLNFKGANELAYLLQNLNGNLEKTIKKSLSESAKYVAGNAEAAMSRHNKTHKTVNSIDHTYYVEKKGSLLRVPVGFHVSQGGLASIFLMYGTPRVAKDTNLYNAIRGTKTRKHIAEIQEKAFTDAVNEAKGG